MAAMRKRTDSRHHDAGQSSGASYLSFHDVDEQ